MEEYSQITGKINSDNKVSISIKLCIDRNPFGVIWNMLLHLLTYYWFLFKLRKFYDYGLSTEVFLVFRSYQNLTVIDIIMVCWRIQSLYSKRDIAPDDWFLVSEYCTWMYLILRNLLNKGGFCITCNTGLTWYCRIIFIVGSRLTYDQNTLLFPI